MKRSPVQFAEYELDWERFELRRGRRSVDLERMPMELLILLIEKQGMLVERDEIVARLWGKDAFVDATHGINTAVKKIRSALRDDADQPRFIQTVKGKGYRFVADVHEAATSEKSEVIAAEIPALCQTLNESEAGRPLGRGYRIPIRIAILSVICAIVLLLLLNIGRWWRSSPAAQGMAQFQSLAVLPLTNLSQDPDQEYFADGLTDELITDLAQFSSLRVISHTSVMRYKNVKQSLPEIAKALHVDAIVEGSVLHSQGRVRITAQLLDARNDRHLWAQSYARDENDIVAMQDEVARDIGHEVVATLQLPGQEQADGMRSYPPEAYDAYLRGRYFWNRRTLSDLNQSIEFFRQAINSAPKYSDAYAALGDAYVLLSSYGGPGPAELLLQARAAAEQALRLNSRLGEAYTVLGAVKVDYDWDWPGAETEYRRAITFNPGYPTARHWYGLHLARMGRYREAELEMRRALELDPLSLIINTDAAEVLYCARRPEEALVLLRRSLEMNPNFGEAHLVLGKIYEQKNWLGKAVTEFQTASKLFGASPNVQALRGHALALSGKAIEAQKIASDLEELSGRRYVSSVDIAIPYCGLREPGKAVKWLQRGLKIHDKGMNILASDPLFDGCRADPQFQEVLRRLNLEPAYTASLMAEPQVNSVP